MNGNVIKRVWAWIMVACMLFTMVPAFAEETAVEAPVETSAPAAVEETAEAPAETPAEPEAAPEEAVEAPADDTEPAAVPEEQGEVIEEAPAEEPVEIIADDAVPKATTPCAPGTHVWDPTKTTVQVKGNCTTHQMENRTCSVCGRVYRYDAGLKHNFQQVTLPADCTHGPRTGYQCMTPGCTGGPDGKSPAVDPAHPLVETGDPLGHAWTVQLTNEPATCEKEGKIVWQCSNPNCPGDETHPDKAQKEEIIPATGHTPKPEPEADTIKATCTTNEQLKWLCVKCGKVAKTEDKPNGAKKTGHQFGDWEKGDNGTHKRKCAHYDSDPTSCPLKDGYEVEDCQFVEVSRKAPTCVKGTVITSRCRICENEKEDEEGKPDPNNHKWTYYDPANPTQEADVKCGVPIEVILKCNLHETPFEGGKKTIIREHDYKVTSFEAADCMNPGKKVETCQQNGCTDTRTTTLNIDPTAHAWGDEVLTKPAGCVTDAYTYRKCTHTVKGHDDQKCTAELVLATLPGTATGHDYYKADGSLDDDRLVRDESKDASCEEDGLAVYQCSKCPNKLEVILMAKGHTAPAEGATFQNRTCERADRYEAICVDCNKPIPSMSYDIEGGRKATGHNITKWTHSSGTNTTNSKHKGTCSNAWCDNADKNFEVEEKCTFKQVVIPATCHTTAKSVMQCTKCGQKYDEKDLGKDFDPDNHDWDYEGATDVAATCTKPGTRTIKCKNYDQCKGIKVEVLEAKHTWTVVTNENANELFTDGTNYKPKAANCHEAGYHYEVCTTQDGCTAPGNDGVTLKSNKKAAIRKVVDPATGDHHYKAEDVIEATCTKDATDGGLICGNPGCGYVDPNHKPGPIAGTAKGHAWDKGVTTAFATCTEGGTITYTCTRTDCDGYITTPGYDNQGATGEVKGADGDYKAIKVVPTEPVAHTPSTTDKFYQADCLHPDRWVTECVVCHTILETKPVENGTPATGHRFNKEPWRYLDNGKHGRTCINCKKVIDAPCANSETSVATPANCTNPAGTVYTCYVCGHERFVASGTTLDKDNHDWETKPYTGDKKYGPTCTDVGVGQKVCKLCGKKGTYEAMPAQHEWDAGTVTTDATCDTDGVRTFTCNNPTCPGENGKKPATKTEAIPATGHAWDNGVVTKEATCSTPGTIVKTCQLCGKTEESQTPLAAHTFVTNVPDDSGFATINYCKVCGAIQFVAWKDGITAAQKNCENVKKTTDGVEHKLDPAHITEDRDKIEATKDKPGHEAGVYCTRCERYISGGEEIPYVEPEHTEHVWSEAPVPDGSMSCMITYCVECGEIMLPLDPENWLITEGRDCTKVYYEFNGEKHYAKHAELVTETEPGYTEGKKCPSCGMWVEGHEPAAAEHVHEYVVDSYSFTADFSKKIAHVTCTGCDKTWDVEMGLTDKFDPSMIKE